LERNRLSKHLSMNPNEILNSAIINGILKGGKMRLEAIEKLYNDQSIRAQVRSVIRRARGHSQDWEDIFHDGIIVLEKNIRQGKFKGDSKLSVYLAGICKYICFNYNRKEGRQTSVEEIPRDKQTITISPEELMISEELKTILSKELDKLKEPCKEVLRMWQLNYKAEEIAQKLNLNSASYARKQKFRCIKKLMESIKANKQVENYLKSK